MKALVTFKLPIHEDDESVLRAIECAARNGRPFLSVVVESGELTPPVDGMTFDQEAGFALGMRVAEIETEMGTAAVDARVLDDGDNLAKAGPG